MNTTTQESTRPLLHHSTDQSFDADLEGAPLALVKFTGDWCPPCKALQPTLDAVAAAHPEVTVLSVDVDANQAVSQRFGIRALPTLLAFRDGKPVGQLVGNQARAAVEKLLLAFAAG